MMDSLEKRTKMDVAKPKKLFFIQILLTYGAYITHNAAWVFYTRSS